MASMVRDDTAVDSIPVALAGTVILIALIIGVATFGLKNVAPAVRQASADGQANSLASDCRFLLSLAPRCLDDPGSPRGASRTMELNLPDGTEYFSFGLDPETGEGCEGAIYYKAGGSKKVIVVDEMAAFRSPCGGSTLLRAGRYRISIEYAIDSTGHRYLLVSGVT